MSLSILQCALLLQRLPGIPDRALLAVLASLESPINLFDSAPDYWHKCGIAEPAVAALLEARNIPNRSEPWLAAQRDSLSLKHQGVGVVSTACERFPALLQAIREPPPFLYFLGDIAIATACQVAMVGSRRASSSGRRLARALAGELVAQGLVVTSGLALGIDGEAHRGALIAGGNTVAVMATGIDRLYPRRHGQLAADIRAQGCLVTEFPPGSEALPWRFPRRNRIISGLALGTVVVEARLPSGSLITAGTALDQGREVMAVPHGAGEPGGAGCHRLLRDGAALVESAEDVMQALNASWSAGPCSGASISAPEILCTATRPACQRTVLELLGNTVTGLDQLVQDSGYPGAQVLAALTELELDGLARRAAGGYCRP